MIYICWQLYIYIHIYIYIYEYISHYLDALLLGVTYNRMDKSLNHASLMGNQNWSASGLVCADWPIKALTKWTITGSTNGLSPGRCKAIIWTSAGLLVIAPVRTYLSEIWIQIQQLLLRELSLKMASIKWIKSLLMRRWFGMHLWFIYFVPIGWSGFKVLCYLRRIDMNTGLYPTILCNNVQLSLYYWSHGTRFTNMD